MILFSGTSNIPLARKVAKNLKIKLGKIDVKKFVDGETYVNVKEKIEGKNCFVLQSGSNSANENLMELLIIIDALKRLKPKKIVSVLPFYPYRRQERRVEKGEAITSELCAKLLKAVGIDKLIVLDLHSKVVEKFFKVYYNHLSAFSLFVSYFQKKKIRNAIVIAPDEGALLNNKKLARVLGISCGYIRKSRERKHDVIEKMELKDNVLGKNIIMLDDEINTGGTLIKAANLLKQKGAKNIYFVCTHGVLAEDALLKLKKSSINEIIITDSIDLPKERRFGKIKVLSVADVIAKAIKENN